MLYRTLASLVLALSSFILTAQSGRVYDDQKMDMNQDNVHWYDTPFFWIGVIIFALIVGYWIYKRQQNKEPNPLEQ